MKKLLVVAAGMLQLLVSCDRTGNPRRAQGQINKAANLLVAKPKVTLSRAVDPAALLKDFTTWYSYTYYNIKLSQNFVGLDVDSSAIPKSVFLARLATGRFIPVKVLVQNKLPYYQLYRSGHAAVNIQNTMQQLASTEIAHFGMEGKELPAYSFTDLNGKTYRKASTKGKIMVMKCWFIGCQACVKEFPELNKLVDKFQGRKDVLFISLALDNKQALVAFLKTKGFKYAVIPNTASYTGRQLRITQFPTHILVGKDGRIVKVVNALDDLMPFVAQQAGEAAL